MQVSETIPPFANNNISKLNNTASCVHAGGEVKGVLVVMSKISEGIKNIKHARLVILIIVLFNLPVWSL